MPEFGPPPPMLLLICDSERHGRPGSTWTLGSFVRAADGWRELTPNRRPGPRKKPGEPFSADDQIFRTVGLAPPDGPTGTEEFGGRERFVSRCGWCTAHLSVPMEHLSPALDRALATTGVSPVNVPLFQGLVAMVKKLQR